MTHLRIYLRYSECLSVLLTKDDPDFNRQMRLVVNKRDSMGNTPLHYATTAGNIRFGPWGWSSGQGTLLLIQRSEFESH